MPHIDLATSEAAGLVLGRNRYAFSAPQRIFDISESLIPIFGISWDISVIRWVGSGRIRQIHWRLCNSKLPSQDCNMVRSQRSGGIRTDSLSHLDGRDGAPC